FGLAGLRFAWMGMLMPLTLTWYGPPAVLLAVEVTLPCPLPLSVAAIAVTPPVKVAVAPAPGAVKVIWPPLTGSLEALLTVATKGAPKAVRIGVLCGEPLVAATVK